MSDLTPGFGHDDATLTGQRLVVKRGGQDAGAPPGIDPTSIGRFRVLERAGAGAMGVVYAAYDADLDRRVAVKLVLVDEVSLEAEDRLRAEARAMAQIDHPNVLRVYEVGSFNRRPYIAMDYVDGPNLRGWLEAKPAWGDIVALFVQAARGLAAAHDEGIVHRDLKPDNVLVSTTASGQARAHVADFGIASAIAGTEEVIDPLAATGISPGTPTPFSFGAGTPAYMAPERYMNAPADERTDQFAFCVTLFEALAGRRPYEADNLVALAEAILSGRRLEVPRNGPVPRRVWAVVERGLSTVPENRFASMHALADALAFDPRQRRRRILALAGGGAALALGTASWAYADYRARADCVERASAEARTIWSTERRNLVAPAFEKVQHGYAEEAWARVDAGLLIYAEAWQAAKTDVCIEFEVDERLPTEIHDARVECLELARLAGQTFVEALAGAEAPAITTAPRAVRELPPVSHCTDPSVVDQLPLPDDRETREEARAIRRDSQSILVERALGARPQGSLATAVAIEARADAVGYAPLVAEAAYYRGFIEGSLGKFEEAEASLERALQRAAEGRHQYLVADAWLRMLWLLGPRSPDRVPDLVRGARAAIDAVPFAPRRKATLETILGSLASHQGDYETAIEHQNQALERWRDVDGDHALPMSAIHNNLGFALHKLERLEEASDHYRTALEMKERVLGTNHPYLATTLHNIGMIAREEKELKTSRESLERALALTIVSVGEEHQRTANVLSELSATLLVMGEREEAAAAARRGLAIVEALPEPPQWLVEELRVRLNAAE